MPRISRGCLRCRERRVKCDETRPVCRRCMGRGEICVGYRDDSELLFRNETAKTVQRVSGAAEHSIAALVDVPSTAMPADALQFNRASGSGSSSALFSSAGTQGSSALAIRPANTHPGALAASGEADVEEQAVQNFLGKYVVYPVREASVPGFLEHLPSLFIEANVTGRHALRSAVLAAALADASSKEPALVGKALDSYGRALKAMAESLGRAGKEPDDYDLMTVVVLDIFETLYLPDLPFTSKGAHAQGMAHILRLRGQDQFQTPRGWALFRLAHHRLQKQQLTLQLRPLEGHSNFTDIVPESFPINRLDRNASEITDVCLRAQKLMQRLGDSPDSTSAREILELIREMQEIDHKSVSWRNKPEHSFETVSKNDVAGALPAAMIAYLPDTVELHRDVWSAYEWNYHRTARLILHKRLLGLIHHVATNDDFMSSSEAAMVPPLERESTTIINALAKRILSTVLQSLGDVDHKGQVADLSPGLRAIGAYFLLWPIKVLKTPFSNVDEEYRKAADAVYERIREYTGMRAQLGPLSII